MAWRIFEELERLRDDMNRLVATNLGASRGVRSAEDVPLNLYETPEEIIAVAEIPGADRQKFEISLAAGMLSIKGEYKEEGTKPERVREERSKGSFRRLVNVSDQVDPSKVDARYRDGILTVRIAKAETAKPKQIQVKVS